MKASSEPPATTGAASIADRQEHAENVARSRSVLTLGVAMWLGFLLIDWTVVHYQHYGSFTKFATIRLVSFALLVACVAPLHRAGISPRGFAMVHVLLFQVATISLVLLIVDYGGIGSPYLHGVSCLLAAQGIAVPRPWRRGAMHLGLTAVTAPLGLVIASFFRGDIAAQFRAAASLTLFLQQTALIGVSCLLLVAGADAFWRFRRQVFESRNIGRYRLLKKIGSGGMGEVWKAWHPALKRDVAVKILTNSDRKDASERRFEREIEALTALTHANTVRVFDCGVTEDGLCFYVMELLDGETLAEAVARDGPMSALRAIHVTRQAARALAEAHRHGIIHRDVKPGNIFVTTLGGERDFVKVLDFGIARIAHPSDDRDGAALTQTGSVLGTPAFMSPEQVLGSPVDVRSDVYGLGAVLYFALTGSNPFAGESSMAVMAKHLAHDVVPPSKRRAGVPEVLDRVVLRCLAKAPDARYADALALDEELRSIESQLDPLSLQPPDRPRRDEEALRASETPTVESSGTLSR